MGTREAVAITPLITLGGECVGVEEAHLRVRNGRPASVATVLELRELLTRLDTDSAWIEAKIHYAETGVWLYDGLA